MAVPTLVCHKGGGISDNGVGVNNAQYFLTNPTLAGNCIVLCLSWTNADGTLSSITDDGGNTWSTTPAVAVNSASGVRSGIWVLLNCNANTKSITVAYSASVGNFHFSATEFCNIATSSALNGTTSAATVAAPSLAAGSFTPTTNNDANGGNLIFAYFRTSLINGNGAAPTDFTPGSGFTLLDGELNSGGSSASTTEFLNHACEYQVQATQAAINPGMTATGQTSTRKYNCLAIALKAASAGNAYSSANGIHVRKVLNYTNVFPATGTRKVQCPSEGNLRVVTVSFSSQLGISTVTDSDSNTYTKISAPTADTYMFYAANCTANNALQVTITTSAGVGQSSSVHFFDVEFAATSPLGATNDNSVTVGANLRADDDPTLTPQASNSLILASGIATHGPILNNFDPAATNPTPSAAVFDNINYTGQTDNDPIDNADALAHYYNPNTNTIHWNWVTGASASSVGVVSAEFKTQAASSVNFATSGFFDTPFPKGIAANKGLLPPFRDFTQGPFAGTSPAIGGNYFTQALFEPIKLKQPIIHAMDNPPGSVAAPVSFAPAAFFEPAARIKLPERLVEAPPKTTPFAYVTQGLFEPVAKLKQPERLIEAPPGTSPAITAPYVTQGFFEPTRKFKLPERFQEAPPGTQPAIAGNYFTQALFDAVALLKPRDGFRNIFVAPILTPLTLAAWFDQIALKRPTIDYSPVLFTPVAAPAAFIVEQPLFDAVALKRPSEFTQGPFAGTSPAITSPYWTQSFFDTVRPRQPILDKAADLAPLVFTVNLSASGWFDAIRLLKLPERLGELYPQQYWTPQNFDPWFDQLRLVKLPDRLQEAFGVPFPPGQSISAWFDQLQKLKLPGDFPFTATGATQPVTIQNALTDWYRPVKPIQPTIDPPLVVYFPPQVLPNNALEWILRARRRHNR